MYLCLYKPLLGLYLGNLLLAKGSYEAFLCTFYDIIYNSFE